ncbi:hypothetical protein IWX90DRAFT_501845 [Phyllosticta citrichinensis]|uniref:Fucose-specific lectin n=1 Tax=Phyllosticta citrichinensis TaxID=1130410 RepID=A0ABR1XWK7_9PEZI
MAADDEKAPAIERFSTLEVDHSSELPEVAVKAANKQADKPPNDDGSSAPEVVNLASAPQSMSMLSPKIDASSDPRYSYTSVPGYANSSGTPDARFSHASAPVDGVAVPPTPLEGPEPKGVVENGRKRTICGIRRRTFWLCLSIVLVFIVAAAVGGGVGGVLGTRKSSSSSSSNNNNNSETDATVATAGTGTANATTTRRLLPNSNLATVNYTDSEGANYNRLYYQTASLDIAMKEWNSASSNWSTSAIIKLSGTDSNTKIEAKNGTPIAAYVYWRADGKHTFELAFLDKTNLIRAYSSNISAPSSWSLSSADSLVRAAGDSSLAAYATGCSVCLSGAQWLLYQDDDGSVNALAAQNGTNSDRSIASGSDSAKSTDDDGKSPTWNSPVTILPSTVPGTALAAIPIFPVQGNEPKAAVYANANALKEVYFIPSASPQWEPLTSIAESSAASAALSPAAGIAAFARDVADELEIAVLTTKSGAAGGVAVTWWDGAKATWGRVARVAGMEGVNANSPMAANQAGSVYAFADGGNGTQVVEWRFAGGAGTGDAAGAARWEKFGVVPLLSV